MVSDDKLDRQMSRMDRDSGNKKGGAGKVPSNHGRARSGMSFPMSSWEEGFPLSEAGPPPSAEPVALPMPMRSAGASAATRQRNAAAGGTAIPAGGVKLQHQPSHLDSNSRVFSGVSAEASSATASDAAYLFAASGSGDHRTVASGASVQYLETPPPLRGNHRRPSLLNHDALPEEEAKAQIEPELMIGEIQVRRMNEKEAESIHSQERRI